MLTLLLGTDTGCSAHTSFHPARQEHPPSHRGGGECLGCPASRRQTQDSRQLIPAPSATAAPFSDALEATSEEILPVQVLRPVRQMRSQPGQPADLQCDPAGTVSSDRANHVNSPVLVPGLLFSHLHHGIFIWTHVPFCLHKTRCGIFRLAFLMGSKDRFSSRLVDTVSCYYFISLWRN